MPLRKSLFSRDDSELEEGCDASAASYASRRTAASCWFMGAGGQAPCFNVHPLADHYNAIESQAGFRAVPSGELFDRVLVDAA